MPSILVRDRRHVVLKSVILCIWHYLVDFTGAPIATQLSMRMPY